MTEILHRGTAWESALFCFTAIPTTNLWKKHHQTIYFCVTLYVQGIPYFPLWFPSITYLPPTHLGATSHHHWNSGYLGYLEEVTQNSKRDNPIQIYLYIYIYIDLLNHFLNRIVLQVDPTYTCISVDIQSTSSSHTSLKAEPRKMGLGVEKRKLFWKIKNATTAIPSLKLITQKNHWTSGFFAAHP